MSISPRPPAGLHYATDAEPGVRRRGRRRFTYVDERTGRRPSTATLQRIHALVIPPAWTDVWIATDAQAHLQATGRDARGRKQYRYHESFTAESAEQKFGELGAFGTSLGGLRRRVARDLRSGELGHDQVVAVVVRLMDLTSLRVGNETYARDNRSYGLTTLRTRHAHVRGSAVRLSFRGKSAHDFDVTVENASLARIVRRCQHLPGQHLFQYTTIDGERRAVGSRDVNEYLSAHGHPGSTAKTFRTWNATVAAAARLATTDADGGPTAQVLNAVIDSVADDLGNTRAVCRTSYIHPVVVERFLDGSLPASWNRAIGSRPTGLSVDERRTLRLVRAPTSA